MFRPSPNGRSSENYSRFKSLGHGRLDANNARPPNGRGAALRPRAQAYTCRSTSAFFNSAISFAGLSPFGQAFEQFMMVWQR